MILRSFHSWRAVHGVRTFCLFSCWYFSGIFCWGHCVGVTFCNFSAELYWGKTA